MAFSLYDVESARREAKEPVIDGILNRVVGHKYEKFDIMEKLKHHMGI